MERWIELVREHTGHGTRIVLLGNKSDLEGLRQVPASTARQLAEREGLAFLETSAKTAENVEEALQLLIASIYEEKSSRGSIDSSMVSIFWCVHGGL